MSSRHQKDKRLRPKSDPYKRDHFNKSRYMGQAMPSKVKVQPMKEEPVEEISVDETVIVVDETIEFVSGSSSSAQQEFEEEVSDCH